MINARLFHQPVTVSDGQNNFEAAQMTFRLESIMAP